MTLPVRFHPLAEADLVDAWAWYEARQQGLGDRFIDAVRAALDIVAQRPNTGTPAIRDRRGVAERRTIPSGFPYAIRYRTIDDVIVVMAIHHQHCDPDFGTDRSTWTSHTVAPLNGGRTAAISR